MFVYCITCTVFEAIPSFDKKIVPGGIEFFIAVDGLLDLPLPLSSRREPLLPQEMMVMLGKAVRLVPDILQQTQRKRAAT